VRRDAAGRRRVRVTAVVVSWNAAGDLPGCLDALLAQDHEPPVDVLVVDNASGDGSREVLAAYGDGIRTRLNTTNRGFAGAVDDALGETDADAVLLVNPDAVVRPDLVRRLSEALAADARRGAVQPKLLRPAPGPDGRPVIDTTGHVAYSTRLFGNRGEGEPDDGRWDRPGEVFGVSGACALYRRRMLDDLALPDGEGPFDTDLFAFFEDVDLDWRARRRGWSAWYEPAAVGVHERGGAGPRRTAVVERLNYRNRLLVVAANDHVPALLRALPAVLATTLLKTVDLAVTAPSALLGALCDLVRLGSRTRAKRAHVDATATVPAEDVVARWFGRFDYARWVRMWWRRVRGDVAGH
jgi:GT2 family glycosyltransferase